MLEINDLGTVEVQISFVIRDAVFVRVRDSKADQLISFAEGTPFLELTYEQPSSATRANQILEEVDPVFGVDATDGKPLLLRRDSK